MAKKEIIKNSISGIIQLVLTAILTLVSVPLFISKLGLDRYGVFAVVSVIGNLNMLTNFGLNNALLTYVAKQGKCRESDHDIAVTQIIMTALMLFMVCLVILGRTFIVSSIFGIESKFSVEAESLLIYLIIANSFLLIGQSFTAIIDAQQKMYLSNFSQLIYSLIYWGGQILILSFGGDLSQVGIVSLLAAVIWFVLVLFFSHRLWGDLDISGLRFNFSKVAKKQLSYGGKIYLSGVAGFMFEPLSKLLLANFVGLQVVALFEIGTKIRGQITGLINKAFCPIYPYIAQTPISLGLHANLYNLSKKIQLVSIYLSCLTIFMMPVLVKLWLGNENYYLSSVFIIALTVAFLLFSPPSLPIYYYVMAKDKPQLVIWMQLSAVVVNIVVFFIAFPFINIYAILLSNTLGFLASYILSVLYQCKYFNVKFDILYYFRSYFLLFICCLLSSCVLLFVPIGLNNLLIFPIGVTLIFVVGIRELKLIEKEDISKYFAWNTSIERISFKLLIK